MSPERWRADQAETRIGPAISLEEVTGPARAAWRPRCSRCGVTTRGMLWRIRHRIGTCHPARLDDLARFRARAAELYAREEAF